MIKAKYFFKLSFLLTAFFMLWSNMVSAQFDIPDRPESDYSLIFNYAKDNILSSSEQQALNRKLIDYEGKTSTQIALIIIDSLKGEDPNFLAANWGHKWEIGQKDADNGLVILMSTGDRRIAIQNGYGLEEFMTDARSQQVIDHFIIPYFKQGQFYQGFEHGIDAIFRVLEGKFVEDGTGYNQSNEMDGLVTFLLLALGMFLLFWLLSRRNRRDDDDNDDRFGGGRTRSPFGDVIFTDFGRSTWSGRSSGGFGGGFGSGGGGFGGFGGGGFGGGGASGGW